MPMRRTHLIYASGIVLVLNAVAAAQDAAPLDIGSRLELFADTYVIDKLDGAQLRLQSPVPAETVLEFDKPWEGEFCAYATVIKDADRYRLYYRGLPESGADGSAAESTCYAESTDGIHFTKPNLGLFEVFGTRDNNAILHGFEPLSHNFAPFVDTRPDVDAAQRYKALGGTSSTGLVAFVSADGVNWRKLRDEAVINQGALDSQNVAFWSESERQYVCYLRTFDQESKVRTVSRCTSKDFVTWTDIAPMEFGGATPEHLYTNQTTPYFRAPHLYVAIAARFMEGRRVVSEELMAQMGGHTKYSGDCSDAVLLTTRGGTHYDRTFMEGFIRPGIGMNNWTSRTNYPARGVVPTGESEMSMYVQRNYGQKSHHLQRLVMRTDGFASVHAPYGGGEMITKPLTFDGVSLAINFSTSAAGSVWIELQRADGTPIPGFTREECDEIVGDEITRIVTWKGDADVSPLSGGPVRVRAVLKDADLFSVQFMPKMRVNW
ncbi:MAG: hypothetical protein HUU46_08955 [Candidatus Hydrogenedentes bacterium]|nr:hypothetical protein [Candidatus Hydrogenedentota bacterium]